jgi:hypothetical protein
MTKITSLAKSRRFWAAVTSVVVVILHEAIGLDEATAQGIAATLLVWILGDSVNKTA